MNVDTIARRLGSRWCCAWQVGATLVVMGLVLSAGLRLGLGWPSYLRSTAVELAADAVGAVVLLVAAMTVLHTRDTRVQPVWLVVAVWICVAAARLVCSILISPDPIGATITFNVAIPVWALVVIYLFATMDEGRSGAREIAEANAELIEIQEHTQDLLEQEERRLIEAVQGRMAAEVAGLRESVRAAALSGASASITALADRVADYSTRVVRSTSHRLREPDVALLGAGLRPGSAQVPWPSLFDVYMRARQPIVLPVAVIAMRGFVGSLLRWDPSTLRVQALIFTCLLAAAWAGRAIIDRVAARPSARELILSSGLVVLLAIMAVWGFALARAQSPANPALIPLPAIGVFVVGVFVLGRLVSGVNLRWARVTEELAEVNSALADANRELTHELAQVRERLADVLHGPVQGRLAAASMALRLYADAQASGREGDLPATLHTTTLLLDRAIQDLQQIGQRTDPQWPSVDAGLDHVAQTWAGLVTVTWSVVDAGVLSAASRALVVATAGELVTNASRHADARHVELRVRAAGNLVEIDATNDGRPPRGTPEPGAGLGMLARHDGTWAIERGADDRTRVRVRVPVIAE